MPIFGLLFYLLSKISLTIKSKYLTNLLLETRIAKSSIRFLSSKERVYIANTLRSYNTLNSKGLKTKELDDETKNKIKQLNEVGYCSLGKKFSDQECEKFIETLQHETCFNSQTPMQSDGVRLNFRPNSDSAHFVFLPESTLSFSPLITLLSERNINDIIDSYLNYRSTIYNVSTWYNPEINKDHYVHRLHRDSDDYRFLTLIIYWTKVTRSNGSTSFVKKSHRLDVPNLEENKIFLEGEQGCAFLADLNAFHAGSKILEGYRYATQIRFGKDNNYATVVDGYVQTPTSAQLESIYRL